MRKNQSTGAAPVSKNETYQHRERLMNMYDLPGISSDDENNFMFYQSFTNSRMNQNHSMLPRLAKASTQDEIIKVDNQDQLAAYLDPVNKLSTSITAFGEISTKLRTSENTSQENITKPFLTTSRGPISMKSRENGELQMTTPKCISERSNKEDMWNTTGRQYSSGIMVRSVEKKALKTNLSAVLVNNMAQLKKLQS